MPFLRDLALGLDGFFRAFRFAMRNGMGWMFLVPALLWAALTYGLYVLMEGPVDAFTAWVGARFGIPVEEGEAGWWHGLKAFINGAQGFLVAIVLKLAIAWLLFTFNKYIVLVLLSPLLAHASERTEELLTGRVFPFGWTRLMKDALRGSLIALRNGALEVAITIGVWAITLLVPLLAPVSFVLLFLVSAYFYGFSMFDYVFERRSLRMGESVRAVNDRMGAVLANGALFSLLMKVPLLGVVFAPLLAAVGAVLAEVRREAPLGHH